MARTFRLAWLNLTTFAFHKPLPASTIVYGKVRVLHRPCRFEIGSGCRLGDGLYLATTLSSKIQLGRDVSVQLGCTMVATESITIGDHVAIAEYVTIRDQEHRFRPGYGVRRQGYNSAPVTLGDNCWIGRGAYIGPGTTIGKNSIVGANSVVRGTFPDGVLIAGAPAVIKKVLPASADVSPVKLDHG
jgi:acetyltransferase-like isoleucine patch superfamily enzyme